MAWYSWKLLLLSIVLFLDCSADAGEQHERPNVVLVMTDDQGYGDLGLHGNPNIKTPHLDQFGREGIQLTRFYCSPVCAPTRASLMTGRYYYRTGIIHTSRGGAKMRGDEVTVAERFSQAGYKTGIFGKWHLGDNYPMRPQDQGFQKTLIHKSGGIDQSPDKPNSYFHPILWEDGQRVRKQGYCADIFTSAAIDFITDNQKEPFFVYLASNTPHTPLQIAESYVAPYREKGLNDITARVYGMMTNMDDNFGRLMKALDDLELRKNTIVIFLSDNGPEQKRYTANLKGRKSWSYEGGIRVPFFVQWPAKLKGKQQINTIAAHYDVAPTLMSLCGIDLGDDHTFDGISLAPLLRDGKQPSAMNRLLFFQCHRGLAPKPFQNCAVIGQRFKLVGFPGSFSIEDLDSTQPKLELYDIQNDSSERINVADKFPEVVEKHQAAYSRWFADVKQSCNFTPGVIHLGSTVESPAHLCRYQDATYKAGEPTGWSVKLEKTSLYGISVNHGTQTKAGEIIVNWQGKQQRRKITVDNQNALFQLHAGTGMIDIWFQATGRERVVFTKNHTEGDVEITRILGSP